MVDVSSNAVCPGLTKPSMLSKPRTMSAMMKAQTKRTFRQKSPSWKDCEVEGVGILFFTSQIRLSDLFLRLELEQALGIPFPVCAMSTCVSLTVLIRLLSDLEHRLPSSYIMAARCTAIQPRIHSHPVRILLQHRADILATSTPALGWTRPRPCSITP
jgi:hypothetical protein